MYAIPHTQMGEKWKMKFITVPVITDYPNYIGKKIKKLWNLNWNYQVQIIDSTKHIRFHFYSSNNELNMCNISAVVYINMYICQFYKNIRINVELVLNEYIWTIIDCCKYWKKLILIFFFLIHVNCYAC